MVQTSEGATASTTATDEKKPPCRVCDSFKSYSAAESSKERKAFKQQQQKKKENEGAAPYTPFPCPPDSQKLGRSTWTFLHTMAAYYPEKPTKDEQTTAATFFRTFAQLYPCSYCAQHMREDFKTSPPVVTSNKDMSLWLCNLHNKVNEKLGKPTFDCSKVFERWRDGTPGSDC
ncbi:hypothetical protein DFJ73DRAFT_646609 [Zopfochytrium polystomum]|nr:hypothetical protein DFJ73DRAFT_646609 [Zopfochytrium polystomum]